ncbi:hypothetical protein [Serratia phage vB_SmaS_Opt-169]|nr:hypothetical protein [Serratia phage vB_SmaS_Opt-169]
MKKGTRVKSLGYDLRHSARKRNWLYSNGCRYLNYFNGPDGNLTRNLIIGMPEATVFGSPVVGENFVEFTHGIAYLNTGILENDGMTLLAAGVGPNPGDDSLMISNYGGKLQGSTTATTTGTSLMFRASTTASGIVTVIDDVSGASSLIQSNFAYVNGSNQFLAMRFGPALGGVDAWNMTNTAYKNTPLRSGKHVALGDAFLIGSSYGFGTGKKVKMFGAAIFDRVLGASEISTVYQAMKADFLLDNIAV